MYHRLDHIYFNIKVGKKKKVLTLHETYLSINKSIYEYENISQWTHSTTTFTIYYKKKLITFKTNQGLKISQALYIQCLNLKNL